MLATQFLTVKTVNYAVPSNEASVVHIVTLSCSFVDRGAYGAYGAYSTHLRTPRAYGAYSAYSAYGTHLRTPRAYGVYGAYSAYGAYGPFTLASVQFNLHSDLFEYRIKIMFIHKRPTPIAKQGGAGGVQPFLLNVV